MPNPIMSMFPRNTGQRPQKEDMDIEPVPEHYAGYNNPYRGTETHGVEPTVDPRPVPTHAEFVEETFEPPIPEADPIPVVVVTQGGREIRRSRIFQGKANANQNNQLVGRDEMRVKIRVKNLGASDVYIGNNNNTANAAHGWPIRQHEVWESETQGELWVLSSHATDPMTLAVNVVYSAVLNSVVPQ